MARPTPNRRLGSWFLHPLHEPAAYSCCMMRWHLDNQNGLANSSCRCGKQDIVGGWAIGECTVPKIGASGIGALWYAGSSSPRQLVIMQMHIWWPLDALAGTVDWCDSSAMITHSTYVV
jgi:hypothetical protein